MNKTELSHIETLENAVRWDYLKCVLNWPMDKVAYEMYVNERRLREWVNNRASVITRMIKSNPGVVKSVRKKLEKEFPAEEVKQSKTLSLNIIQVVKKHKEGKTPLQLAEIFKCDRSDFMRWWSDNLGIINQEFRKGI